jgi:hypothetical protein
MFNHNKLKEKLKSGNPVLGTWNTLVSPLVTEVNSSIIHTHTQGILNWFMNETG